MKLNKSVCVISINKENKADLIKTLNSVDRQVTKPERLLSTRASQNLFDPTNVKL